MTDKRRMRLRVGLDLIGAVLKVDVISSRGSNVELPRSPDLEASRSEHHLSPVGEPADDSGNGKKDTVDTENGAWVRKESKSHSERQTHGKKSRGKPWR